MYIVEGNTGAGKSTFLSLMQTALTGVDVVQEPVESWNDQRFGSSLLENFYHDTPRWAYTMEVFTLINRVKYHLKEQVNSNAMRLFERSIYSGYYCFALNGRHAGFLNDIEWDIYEHWVNMLVHGRCRPPHGFIYLRASPDVCMDRIRRRNRSAEKEMSLPYVEQIHGWHERFLVAKEVDPSIRQIPVLILDCDDDFAMNPAKIDDFAHQVRTFMSKTANGTGHVSCSKV